MILYLCLTLFFVLCQGFFSGMETGMVSVLRPRAEHAARKGGKKAWMMLYFLHRPGIMIATALIGVNISVVMASLMAKELFQSLNLSGGAALTAGGMVLSVLMLCCEIVPKNWFREAAYRRCSSFIPIFYGFYLLLIGPVRLFAAFTGFLSRLAGHLGGSGDKNPVAGMRDDFRLFLRESQAYGSVDESTASILDRAIDVPGMLINQILIPRGKVRAIPSDMTVRTAFQFCQKYDLTKVPVYPAQGGKKGEWCGVFSIYDAIYSVDEEKWDTLPVSSCAARLYFIEKNLKLGELLERLRFRRIPFFVVLDRNKKQTGIVRPEDLAALLFEH